MIAQFRKSITLMIIPEYGMSEDSHQEQFSEGEKIEFDMKNEFDHTRIVFANNGDEAVVDQSFWDSVDVKN
jgi:hypothetical protein